MSLLYYFFHRIKLFLNKKFHFFLSLKVVVNHALKIEKICFSRKVSIQPCWPAKCDSVLPGAIWAQSGPKKLHGRATVGPISAQGPNQLGLYWPWFKDTKLDSKIGLYFTHRNGPIFGAKTDLSDLQCGVFHNLFFQTFYVKFQNNWYDADE